MGLSASSHVYLVTVDKKFGQRLGLSCEPGGQETCIVKSISNGDLISVWNKANPGSPVKVGDCVAEVNGQSGYDKLHTEMAKDQRLNITFVRSQDAHLTIDVAPGAQPNDGATSSKSVPRQARLSSFKDRYCVSSSNWKSLSAVRRHKVEEKGTTFYGLLMSLESALASPETVRQVGKAYQDISVWTKEAQKNPDADLPYVLAYLAEDGSFSYPPWRRQALEEAYRLFYDEIAKQGDPVALNQLKEPPTSEEIGFRKLPEALVTGAAAKAPYFSGTYEDTGKCPIAPKKWQYEVRRLSADGKAAHGREIVGKGPKQTSDNAGYLQGLLQAVFPADDFGCCSRGNDAKNAKGPLLLPKDAHCTAQLPTDEVMQSFLSTSLPKPPSAVGLASPKQSLADDPFLQGKPSDAWPQQRIDTDQGLYSATGSSIGNRSNGSRAHAGSGGLTPPPMRIN